jgi:hypothetical protein
MPSRRSRLLALREAPAGADHALRVEQHGEADPADHDERQVELDAQEVRDLALDGVERFLLLAFFLVDLRHQRVVASLPAGSKSSASGT